MFVLSKFTKNLLANIFGILAAVALFGFFLEAAMRTPVMEISAKTGECLRVIAFDGQKVKNGCVFARKGMIATESRYVGG